MTSRLGKGKQQNIFLRCIFVLYAIWTFELLNVFQEILLHYNKIVCCAVYYFSWCFVTVHIVQCSVFILDVMCCIVINFTIPIVHLLFLQFTNLLISSINLSNVVEGAYCYEIMAWKPAFGIFMKIDLQKQNHPATMEMGHCEELKSNAEGMVHFSRQKSRKFILEYLHFNF